MPKYKAMVMKMSKGSKPRPKSVSNEQFSENWEKIFGKNMENAKKYKWKKTKNGKL